MLSAPMRPTPTPPEDSFEVRPLDREQWDRFVDRWRQVESRFASEPADAVRQAERLFLDLTGHSGDSPSSTVGAVIRMGRPSSGEIRWTFSGGGDLLSTLPDFVHGVRESYRHVQKARAAARGMSAARDHRDASLDDLQEAMQLYRGLFERMLSVKREDLDSLTGQSQKAAAAESGLAGQPDDSPGAEARDRLVAQRIVNESMRMTDQEDARAERWRIARWGMLGLVGNLAFGLVILLVVIWMLSQQ